MNRPPQAEPDCKYPRVARAGRPGTVVQIGEVALGAGAFCVIAGPCAIESPDQIRRSANDVVAAGADVLRGGAFKPRTSPYSFQGLGLEGVEMMRQAADQAGLPLVTEVPSAARIAEMAPLVDAFQVGARNMHNFELLCALGQTDHPVLLKRSFGATLTEWLLAAEYIAESGNDRIVLCERGIRAWGDELRFTLDLAGAVWAKRRCRLPVVVDPSHATGCPELVPPLCRASCAAGLDGVMVEMHPDPSQARCDGDQALVPPQLELICEQLRQIPPPPDTAGGYDDGTT